MVNMLQSRWNEQPNPMAGPYRGTQWGPYVGPPRSVNTIYDPRVLQQQRGVVGFSAILANACCPKRPDTTWRRHAPYKWFDPIVVNTYDYFSFDFRYNMSAGDKITKATINVVTVRGCDAEPNNLLLPELPSPDPISKPATLAISPNPPLNPSNGAFWWDTVGGQMYFWYSSEWVAATNLPPWDISGAVPQTADLVTPPEFPWLVIRGSVVGFKLYPRIADVTYEIQCTAEIMPCGTDETYQRSVIAIGGLRVIEPVQTLYDADCR